MKIETPFTKATGVEFPIICGAMYPCSNPELIAAVSDAGGMGIVQPISFVYQHGLDLREALKSIRKITDKPFGMNIILVPGYEERLKAWTDIAIEEGCRFFITALGKPTWMVELIHSVGGHVYHDVIHKEHAQKAVDTGVDGLICVNNRAGGHLGKLTPEEMYDQLHGLGKPLICAGGIGDEQAFVHALKIGYSGVQMATRFIATYECSESDYYKQAILNAEEKDIVLTDNTDGIMASVILNPYASKQGLWMSRFSRWLMKKGWLKKFSRTWQSLQDHKPEREKGGERWLQAGKSVGGIHKIEHVKDIINRFVDAASKM